MERYITNNNPALKLVIDRRDVIELAHDLYEVIDFEGYLDSPAMLELFDSLTTFIDLTEDTNFGIQIN